jgi:hypothetical protein
MKDILVLAGGGAATTPSSPQLLASHILCRRDGPEVAELTIHMLERGGYTVQLGWRMATPKRQTTPRRKG